MRLLLLNLLALCICSCASTAPVRPQQLVGHWRYADALQSCDYVFDPDGTFHGEVTSRGRPVSRFRGVWSVNNRTLSYRYVSDALGLIPAGTIDRDELMKVEGNAIVIRTRRGDERKYIRVVK